MQAEHATLVAAVDVLQGRLQAQESQVAALAESQQHVASTLAAGAERTSNLEASHQSKLDSICEAIESMKARSDKVCTFKCVSSLLCSNDGHPLSARQCSCLSE